MVYYPDLSAYQYKKAAMAERTLNIGWLDSTQPFAQRAPTPEFVDRLWSFCRTPFVITRGFHRCNLCSSRGRGPHRATRGVDTLLLGSAEIRVVGVDGTLYAAPDLIYHYVTEHHYRPPDEFVEAVLTGPDPASEEYSNVVHRHGASARGRGKAGQARGRRSDEGVIDSGQ